jgi:hypothetical protein
MATADRTGNERESHPQPPSGGSNQDRDRDAVGRARNARPRDALGRPLTRGADDLGQLDEPPLDQPLPPAQAVARAQGLLDARRPFQAHEVLEAAWKAAPDDERDLWRGLAQLAVGLTHAMRGNAVGAAALLRRGADRIAPYASAGEHGIDAPGLIEASAALAARIEASGLSALAETDLTLKLSGQPAPDR